MRCSNSLADQRKFGFGSIALFWSLPGMSASAPIADMAHSALGVARCQQETNGSGLYSISSSARSINVSEN
jgi:hypothetical protein